jgi:glycosyltransferase involved in cell wall biosynthesis
MALAEAEYLKKEFDVVISVPDGPLRQSFGLHGKLIDGTASLPLWGGSARRWVLECARTLMGAICLARMIRRSGVDLVVTNSSVLVTPVLAARLSGVPVIVHARDVPGSTLAPLVFRVHGALAHTVIVITGRLRPYFRWPGGARIVKLSDGVELPKASAPYDDARPPAASRDVLRLCVIGGVDMRKGQDIAVEAVARLRDTGVPAVLDVVGREIDAEFGAAVRRRAEDLDIAPHVKFVGELTDVRSYLAEVDIVVAPSRDEWTPLALMEAMAEQKPVVAADVGGVCEVISDRDTGLLIPPEDPSRLASAVSEIAEDREGAAGMAFRARRHIEAKFSIDATLVGLEAEIRRLIPTDRSRSLATSAPAPRPDAE